MIVVHSIVEVNEISLNGKNYPYIAVKISKDVDGVIYDDNFGCESLEKELFDENDKYVNDMAENIDGMFYGFIPDEIFKKSFMEIKLYIERYFD